jgi:hypothetical protein
MINQQSLDYIKQQLQQGTNKEQIKNSLIANGWQTQDIEEAFSFIENPTSLSQPIPTPTQTISSFPSATAILSQTWTIYKQRLGTFLGVTITPMLISMVGVFAILVSGKLSKNCIF